MDKQEQEEHCLVLLSVQRTKHIIAQSRMALQHVAELQGQ